MKRLAFSELAAAQERGEKALKQKDVQLEVTPELLEIVAGLMQQVPQSSTFSIGVTPEALQFMEKADSVVTKLRDIVLGAPEQHKQTQDNILRTFRVLDTRIKELADKLDNLDKPEPPEKAPYLKVFGVESGRKETKPTQGVPQSERRGWTWKEDEVLRERMGETLNEADFRELGQKLDRTPGAVRLRFSKIRKKEKSEQ